MEKTLDKIVALAKNRGFVYPGSEIYGGLANTWDYGNLGVELKNNVKKAWWKKFIQENPYNVGVDCAILMNPQTWVASGHLGGFADPLMDCKECHERFRADKLIEDYMTDNGIEIEGSIDGWTNEQMEQYVEEKHICCPSCGKHNFTSIRQFNLMFKTFQGVTEDAKNTVYLRPETAQGIFVNFKNVQRTSRKKIPFGIGQIGKSFRNEITPGNFTFRTREFEPDGPNYTPRISGIVKCSGGVMEYAMSILKSADGIPDSCQRYTFMYSTPLQGLGRYIHTYMGDGTPLPSFEGEPTLVEIGNDDIDTFAEKVWNALDEDNKVSLFVRYIDIASDTAESRIINKNK